MKVKKISIIFLILFLWLYCKKEEQHQQQKDIHIEFIIKTQEKEDSFHLNINQPTSVLEIMNQLKNEQKVSFESKNYNDLVLIVSINNKKNEGNGKAKKNWVYSVNGKLAPMSVSQYQINESSKIQWCFLEWEKRKECGEETQDLNHKPTKE